MTTYLRKNCSFSFLCMSFLNVYHFVCASFPFGFLVGMWDLIVLVTDHCPSFYFSCKAVMLCNISYKSKFL